MAPTSAEHPSAAGASAGNQPPHNPHNRCLTPKKPTRRGPKTKSLKAVPPSTLRGKFAAGTGLQKPKRISRMERAAAAAAAAKISSPCGECGKRFSSEKALFGHMRWHGDPRWRGEVEPPARQLSTAPPRVGDSPSDRDELAEVAAACLVSMSGGQATRLLRPRKSKWKKGDFRGLVVLMATAVSAAATAASAGRARGCGFDLNLPPPEGTEDGVSSSSSSRTGMYRKQPAYHGFV